MEGICKDKAISGPNLKVKIDRLVEQGLLAKPQGELLHEERFIGNEALHELAPPAEADLAAGLDIVETLLRTIYILPRQAQRLRESREKRRGGKSDD